MKPSKPSKKRTPKRHLNYRNIFIILLIFTIIGSGFYYYFNLSVKNILILGTTQTKDVDIIEIANLADYTKISKINCKKNEQAIESLPLVKSAKIKKNLLGKVTITIEERKPLFYYQPEKKTILSDGTRLDDNSYYGLPTIINYVPEDYLNELILGMDRIDQDIIYMINEIEYSPSTNTEGKVTDPLRFIFTMNDGNTVHMNPVNFRKLNNYLVIYDEIVLRYQDEKGVLKLDSDTDAYIFKTYKAIEAEANSEEEPNEE